MFSLLRPLFGIVLATAVAPWPHVTAAPAPMTVSSSKPADVWTDGYGVGNGRLGALSFGVFPKETIVLNEESIFERPSYDIKPNAAKALAEARRLCDEGKYRSADEVFRKQILTGRNIAGNYQQGGILDIEFENIPASFSLRRLLDMEHGCARTTASWENGSVQTELIAAPRHDCVAYCIRSTQPEGCSLRLSLRHPDSQSAVTPTRDGWVLEGRGSNGGTRFENRIRVLAPGARLVFREGVLFCQGAKTLLLLSSTSTDYNAEAPDQPLQNSLGERNKRLLDKAVQAGWPRLREETASYFSERMNRCRIDIEDSPGPVAALDTSERLARVRQGHSDPDLIETIFQFGRYCTIANTRPGALPCGLQGLWNPEMNAAWMGCYFLNINCQMNQWPSEVTGLGEFHRPFLAFVRSLKPYGEQFACILGHEGFCYGHYADCWKKTYFGGGDPEYSASLMNGAWACAHLYDSYLFSGDKKELRQSLPILESSARFVMSWFRDNGKGESLSGPGVSPENAFLAPDGTGPLVRSCVSNGNAHDLLLGREALRHYISACRELGIQGSTYRRALRFLPTIPLPKIGDDGRVQEWREPFEEDQKGHRHISHLYGLFPGSEWNILQTPAYAEAVRKSADFRLQHAGKSGIRTGWSTAWLMNLYAALGDGDTAAACMETMMRHYLRDNLFDMHPPFQIDGNFGFTSGIAMCLIQSRIVQNGRRVVQLGPALPSGWKEGSAEGLRARGGLVAGFTWNPKRLEAKVRATRFGRFRLMHGGQQRDLDLKAGEEAVLSFPRTAD